jgi:hypothetical protein
MPKRFSAPAHKQTHAAPERARLNRHLGGASGGLSRSAKFAFALEHVLLDRWRSMAFKPG